MRLLKLYTCAGKKSTGEKVDFHKEIQLFYGKEDTESNGLSMKCIQKYPYRRTGICGMGICV
jgi:hypothetical protein